MAMLNNQRVLYFHGDWMHFYGDWFFMVISWWWFDRIYEVDVSWCGSMGYVMEDMMGDMMESNGIWLDCMDWNVISIFRLCEGSAGFLVNQSFHDGLCWRASSKKRVRHCFGILLLVAFTCWTQETAMSKPWRLEVGFTCISWPWRGNDPRISKNWTEHW